MAFEGLSDKLGKVFGKLKNHGKLNEKDVKEVCLQLIDHNIALFTRSF